MDTVTEPYLHDLSFRGFIEGLTVKNAKTDQRILHYFGGLPYALPPLGPFRWRQPRKLPACYRYGTRRNPGRFVGGTGICPQPQFELSPICNDEALEEDCLQCNIWVPVGEPPKKGWPVLFYIHGGFLQFGSPNTGAPTNYAALFAEAAFDCIIVMPAYRLNVFGFLASKELDEEARSSGQPTGNFGFWDQRLALEWTHQNISYFGGDAGNITVAGYSAGAYSAFHQLSHDLFLPSHKSIIRRAILWSNGPGIQPKPLSNAQAQFDALLNALSIPLTLPFAQKLTKLRSLPYNHLLEASSGLVMHEFRPFTDGQFISSSLFPLILNGGFARRLKERGVKIMLGECRDEHFVYAMWRPPKSNSRAALRERLIADYPGHIVSALLNHYCPGDTLPSHFKSWQDAFGRIYADMQVHTLQRGLIACLYEEGAGDLVYRYRINWRAECVTEGGFREEWGVTHATDLPIWFFGNGMGKGIREGEKEVVGKWLAPWKQFVKGEDVKWWAGCGKAERGEKMMRRLKEDGTVDQWIDERWDEGVKVWNLLMSAQADEDKMNQNSDAKL